MASQIRWCDCANSRTALAVLYSNPRPMVRLAMVQSCLLAIKNNSFSFLYLLNDFFIKNQRDFQWRATR